MRCGGIHALLVLEPAIQAPSAKTHDATALVLR